MQETQRTPAGAALTDLMLDLLRLTSEILTAGDRLVAPHGLTSARWQILGAIAEGDRPQPVAWQNVQWIVNDLARDGLFAFQPNPHHRRAQLVVLTDKGKQTFDAAMRLQVPWINSLADGLSVKDIDTFHRVITTLRRKLEGDGEVEEEVGTWLRSRDAG